MSDRIEWGVGFNEDGEIRFYDGGLVSVRHHGTDQGAHHRPPYEAPLFDDEITDPSEALRYLADIEVVHAVVEDR